MRITARQVVELVDAYLGEPALPRTVDQFLAGDPDRETTGVAVTMMATLDVLRRCAERRLDLVICHEPLYFHHSEDWNAMLESERDPAHAAKVGLIAQHGLVVRRLHDGLHSARPDLVSVGTARALGWLRLERDGAPGIFDVPTTTLEALAAHVGRALHARAPRYVGDPDQQVSVVAVQPWFTGFEANRAMLADPEVDALVIGESHEWETGQYTADASVAGLGKGLVVAGHVPSEQEGMAEVARRIADLLPDLTVAFVPTADPYHAVPV